MKKLFVLILALALTLTACSSGGGNEDRAVNVCGWGENIDPDLIEQFQKITRSSIRENPDGEKRAIPSNMINCFCMYSDYTPLTLDEWILCDRKRREKLCADGSM